MSSGMAVEYAVVAGVAAAGLAVRGAAVVGTMGVAGALDGLAAASEDAARRGAEMARAAEEAARYRGAVREVVDRNARIAVLARARHSLTGVQPTGVRDGVVLPAPLDVGAQDVEDLLAWCAGVDGVLGRAEEEISVSLAGAMTVRVLGHAVPVPRLTEDGVGTEDGVVAADAASDEVPYEEPDDGLDRTDAVPGRERARIESDLARVLVRLRPYAAPDDRDEVLAAAARVADAPSDGAAATRVTDVRVRVQQANERAEARRQAGVTAARCLQGLAGYEAPGVGDLRTKLEEVVAGTRVPDSGLFAEADRHVRDALHRDERRAVSETLTRAFGGLGYDVRPGFETLKAEGGQAVMSEGEGGLAVSAPGWADHAARIVVDPEHGLFRMQLTRSEAAEGEEQRRADVEKGEQLCAAFEQARERLTGSGVRTEVVSLTRPGEGTLPVTRAGSRQRRTGTRHAERRL